MPVEISFSAMLPSENFIRPLLDRFEAETGVHVRVHLQEWETAWMELVRSSLYGEGPDVSEIGTTWTGDLASMGALRPFSAEEVAEISPRELLLPGVLPAAGFESTQAWAIPWVTGPRMIFYRPDLLALAGPVDSSFVTPESFAETLARLGEAGLRWPWVVWPLNPRQIIQHAATWVWAAGGDFLQPDGRSVAFTSAEALHGFQAYFSLLKYDRDVERADVTPDAFFLTEPGAAMRVSGTWLYPALQAPRPSPGVIDAAPLPGPSFIGGSNLLIWKHTRHSEEALRLVQFLLRPEAQVAYCQGVGLLPARLDALAMPPYADHPFWQVAASSLHDGRTFPAVRMWGLVEERLSAALFAVAMEMRIRPEAEMIDLLAHHLMPLRRRLDLLLQEQG